MILKLCAKVLVFILDLFFGRNPKENSRLKKIVTGANCHLCDSWVEDAHPKGEFVVCEICLSQNRACK